MTKEQRRSIRARLLALALIPSSALLAMWVAITSVLMIEILGLREGTTFTENVGVPVLGVIGDLQAERRYTMEYVVDAGQSRTERFDTMEQIRSETDQTVSEFRTALTEAGPGGLPDPVHARVAEFAEALDALPTHRSALDAASPNRVGGAEPYDAAIEAGLRIWDVQTELVDIELADQARSLTSLLRARELLSQEDALLTYAMAAEIFTPSDHTDFSNAVGAQRYLYTQIATGLPAAERDVYDEVTDTAFFRTVRALENQVVSSGPTRTDGVPVNGQSWKGAKEAVDLDMQAVEESRTAAMLDGNRDKVTDLMLGVSAISTMALAVVVASVLFSVRVVRRLNRRLNALRDATLDYAHARLPAITARLRAGERVDVDADAPPLRVGARDEIGQVTEAFNTAQRAAVDSAAQEARLRAGVRNVFRNVARRAQTLVHRQLGLLDSLEQAETDPAVLESLFRIDHLSTQMRRNAENLMLLTDDRPARRTGDPLSLTHAARAASSEIQDYARVKLLPMPQVRLTGSVAGDVVRLLAELLENATSFSPPHTTVTVRGEALAHGHYALEVEDRGLGMSADDHTRVNEMLAGSSPRFSLADMREDSQLGLIVVATIAQRHSLKVTLRPSPYNGTQAIIVLPPSAISTGPELQPRPPAEVAPAAPERPALHVPAEPRPAIVGAAPALSAPVVSAATTTTAAVAPAAPASEGAPEEPAGTYKGLPRRVRSRQRALAAEHTAPTPPPASELLEQDRSLDEIRQMMSAFQQGTRHGRSGDDSSDHQTPESR